MRIHNTQENNALEKQSQVLEKLFWWWCLKKLMLRLYCLL